MISSRKPATFRCPKWLYQNWQLYTLLLFPAVFYILFEYVPMYGALIAFQKYSAVGGIWGSKWIGFDNFAKFLSDPYFYKLVRNTLLISFYSLIYAFPASIIFALLVNEIRHVGYKKIVQTVSYLPHFISTVVVCGLIVNFLRTDDGIVNQMLAALGFERISFLSGAEYFRTIYVASGIWQRLGWDSIIYLAALAGVNEELYEAATIEGATRFQKAMSVTLPGIAPTISVMLILRVGNMMKVGYEKILLLYSGSTATYETADVISTYVYRRGLAQAGLNLGYVTAVGLFQSVVALILIVLANTICKRISETSLW